MMNRLYWGIVAPKSENEPASSGGRLTDFCCVPQKIFDVAEDEPERVREEKLVELLLAVEVPEEHALDHAAQQRDAEGRAERGDPEEPRARPEPQHRLVRQIGAQHVEGAVREVEHAQHPEDQRQARRDQEQEHRGREAAQALREDKRGVGHLPSP